jgi:hypothetical protein
MRGMPNGTANTPSLNANESAAEASRAVVYASQTGFTINDGSGRVNGNGTSYVYIAIRRGPMKVPSTGTSVFKPTVRSGTNAIASTTGVGFPPSLLISAGNGWSRGWFDRLRGPLLTIESNITAEEVSSTGSVTSYNMDGVSFGADGDHATVNYSGSYAQYYFQRAPSFFDEVCYTGTYTNRTISHNLQAVPELMIIKSRLTAHAWSVYSATVGPTGVMYLNTTGAADTGAGRGAYWNSTNPTASVFSVGQDGDVNDSGETYVNYLFATCAGVSKVGSYTGNGSTQTINCGFGSGGARFVIIKRTDSTGGWYVYDTARGMTTLTDPYLFLNSTANQTATLGSVTTVSTGFAVNAAILAAINTNAATYIFLAIA